MNSAQASRVFSNWKVAGVILGGFLVNIPTGVPSFYGNLSTYVDSYFIDKLGQNNYSTGSLWMVTVFSLTDPVCMVFAGIISDRVGPRVTTLLGVIACNAGMYLSFFTIQHSLWSLHVTLGFLTGISVGICYPMTVLYAAVWAPNNTGLATSIVVSTIGGGALIYNKVITAFINPENLEPDVSLGRSKYFSQKVILTRTPYVFLALGGITSCCQILGLMLLRNHPDFKSNGKKQTKTQFQVSRVVNGKKDTKIESELSFVVDGKKDSKNESQTHTVLQKSNAITPIKKSFTESYGAAEYPIMLKADTDINLKSSGSSAKEKDEKEVNISTEGNRQAISLTPKEVLKTRTFYLLSSAIGLLMLGYFVENNYYKQFGLLHITDDKFMADTGVALNVGFCVCRLLWGLAADKCSVKTVIILMTALHTIATALWYFTAFVDKWFYLYWSFLVQGAQAGTMVLFPVEVLKTFGPEFYTANLGMAYFGVVIPNLLSAFLVPIILVQLGWFWVFFIISSASLLAMLLIFAVRR